MEAAIIKADAIRKQGKYNNIQLHLYREVFAQNIYGRHSPVIYYSKVSHVMYVYFFDSSTSRSPSEGRARIWSSELAKHLQFDLVDTAGMTEDQLREIPYTVVETQMAKQRSAASNSLKVHKNHTRDRVDRIRG